ncbi:unnamed protein product, partial [Mesorhabditis belari]|uniref:Mitochondrial inner membrane protein Mpv17 n=1 Tax=Mesorhabditis belari TaxID=2138241 RepID=A0AAF3F4D9_9BILA
MIVQRVSSFFLKKPLLMQGFVSGMIAASGDAICQLVIEGTPIEKYNFLRTTRFFALGGLLVAPTLYRWFRVLDKIKHGAPYTHPIKRVLVDQLFFSPVFSVIFLMVLRLLENRSIDECYALVSRDWWPLWKTGLMFWPFFQLVNFSIVPIHYRVVTTNSAGLLWNCYVSYRTQKR